MKNQRIFTKGLIAGCVWLALLAALSPVSVVASDDLLQVYGEQREGGGYDFYADSEHIIPVWVQVSFTSLTNLEPDVDLPYQTVIEPGATRVPLFGLDPTRSSGRIGYGLTVTYARGNPMNARHDDTVLYLFPFQHGTKHRVSQGYAGNFTHFGENEYALDFDMAIGTPVLAARGGTVVEVKEDSNVGGPSAGYSQTANYVLIYHRDGSFGNYVHLKQNGAAVSVGDRVEAGELIGYSGNTGQSSGPHLHFDVRLPGKNGRMHSIPVQFRAHDNTAISVDEGRHYYAYHPGKPAFDVTFGTDLVNSDYADHVARIGNTNTIEFRTEEIDSTIVLFVGNGFNYPIDAEISIRMQGITATVDFPVTMRIAAGEERFLTLLRPLPGRSRASYAPSVRYSRVR